MQASLVRTAQTFPEAQPEPYIGNGLIGYRIAPNPFASGSVLVSGFVAEHDPGRFETLAPGPYPFAMDIAMGGSRVDDAQALRQSLDMSSGELTTLMRMPLGDDRVDVQVTQFVSRSCPVLSCQEVRLVVPNAGNLVVRASITCGSAVEESALVPPRNKPVIDLMARYISRGRLSTCGAAAKIDFGGLPVTLVEREPGQTGASQTYTAQVVAGQEVVIRTIAGTVSSFYHPDSDLEACRLANWGAALGFDRLREANAALWAEIWKSRVLVTGDDRAQCYLDSALYYLFSSAHPACRTSIPPFGLSNTGYHGHVFWDTDTYEMPVLLLVSPETAKATVDYRLRCLEPAKARAGYFGYRGAMYPWESDSRGVESTPSHCATGWLEQHINPCVAIAAWQYQVAAGDADHAATTTWPIVKAVAEWVESRVEKTDRGYEILDVVGSDEGSRRNNSSYTNGICAQVLRIACQCAALTGRDPGPRWAEIAEKMFIPIGPAPDGSGDVVYLDDSGPSSGGSTDSFIIGFPFDLPIDREVLRRTYHRHFSYEGGVCMGSSMHVGDGAFLGDREGPKRLFHKIIDDAADPVWGMGTEYTGARATCFLTTMAGLLQSTMMGFTGVRFEPGNWTKYDACLPDGWSRIEIGRIYLGGRAYRLEAENGKRAVLTELEG